LTIDSKIVPLLERELGAGRVLARGDERLPDYGRDENRLYHHMPDCAVLATDAAQVSAVLALAREHRVPVTPRGAGSGLTGGCVPVRGGIVLSVERMNAIVEIDADDLVAVVQPGVITGELQAAAEEQGLFYPPDPASLAFCSIGGNAANNAGGPRAFKYGVTREYVLGLEVGLMGGELLRCGRRTTKGVTGYDLVAGFVGSEGTFGVITELTMKLLPKPPAVVTLLAVFPDTGAAGAAVDAMLHKGFRPRTMELCDRASVEHVRPKARYNFPADTGAILLIELDGDAEGLEAAMIRVGQLCEGCGAGDVLVARDVAEGRALWEARRLISPSLREAHRHKISEDVCVPRGAIPELLRRIDRLAARVDMPMATFGHAGDGNLHVNLLVDDDIDDPAVAARIEEALTQIFRDTVELRGTLSGEHGVGMAKQRFMPMEQSERLLAWQRRWKHMWDPDDLLNPGKVLPAGPRLCHEG
jgi:glycolate oxidase